MSTRSLIGKNTAEGIKYIYCHFDGYLSGVGETLKEYYNTDTKIDELISLGSISSLSKNIKLEPIQDIIKLNNGKVFECSVNNGDIIIKMDGEKQEFKLFDFRYYAYQFREKNQKIDDYIDKLLHEIDDVTIAYHRDRGEPLDIGICTDKNEYLDIARECFAEFVYLWDGDTWLYCPLDGKRFRRF